MDNGQPLWLPKGSVRAILALIVVGVVFGRIALGQPVDEPVLGAAVAVLGGYGVYRAVEGRQSDGLK